MDADTVVNPSLGGQITPGSSCLLSSGALQGPALAISKLVCVQGQSSLAPSTLLPGLDDLGDPGEARWRPRPVVTHSHLSQHREDASGPVYTLKRLQLRCSPGLPLALSVLLLLALSWPFASWRPRASRPPRSQPVVSPVSPLIRLSLALVLLIPEGFVYLCWSCFYSLRLTPPIFSPVS